MSRLSEIFKSRRRCFLPFVTAGHPDLERTREILLALAEAGADIIELGIPFSDPIADGPIIQASSFSALSHGYTIEDYLEAAAWLRQRSPVGLILMTYFNPVFSYGLEKLEERAVSAGVDGILISDLTPDEYQRMEPFRELDTIFLAAPTSSDERLEKVAAASRGFVYLVARTGVTGAQTDVTRQVPGPVARLRRFSDLPIAAGFGVTCRSDVEHVWEWADGAIVGSAIVQMIQDNRHASDLPARVGKFVQTLIPEDR